MTNITRLIEAVGWMGALFSLAAYTLLSMGRLDGRSRTYQWMNVAAAAGFVINSGSQENGIHNKVSCPEKTVAGGRGRRI